MAKRRRNRILNAAQAEALIRYQPQLDGLRALMGQAEANYAGKVNEARAGQQAIQGSVSRVAPALHNLVHGMGLDAAARGVNLTSDVAELGDVANSIKAAVQLEGTGAANRLAQTDAFNMADLGNRYVQAAQGAVFAKRAARQGLESDVGKISDEMQSVLGQKGAFTASTVEKLTQAAADRALRDTISRRSAATTRRGQTLSDRNADARLEETRRHNRAGERAANRREKRLAAAAVKAGPSVTPKFGVKVRTAGEHATVMDGIEAARSFAEQYHRTGAGDAIGGALGGSGYGASRETVEKWLVQGRPSQTVEVDGKKVTLPSIPKASSPLAARIALDLVYDGQISREHAEELWRRGILLRGVGLKLPRSRGGRGATRPAGTSQSAGGVRPT